MNAKRLIKYWLGLVLVVVLIIAPDATAQPTPQTDVCTREVCLHWVTRGDVRRCIRWQVIESPCGEFRLYAPVVFGGGH
jgi:hypothetical protein